MGATVGAMTYIPFAPEIGAKYTLTGPDGTVAVFNDPTDPNYVGVLSEVTGLDSAPVRESADDLVQTDGGWHGDFWYSRRPITLSGTVYGHSDAASRALRIDRMRTASNAMRGDAILSWQNNAVGSVPMQTWVRRQQPLRISGNWNKDFQMLFVSQFAPLFSQQLHQQTNVNLIGNPSFETNTNGWSGGTTARVAFGSAITRVTTTAQSGAASAQVVTSTTPANQGIDWGSLTVVGGQEYTVSAYVKGNAGGETLRLVAGDATVGTVSTNITATTSFQRVNLTFVPSVSGTTGIAVINTTAGVSTFFVDAVQVVAGPTLPPYFDTVGTLVAENHGDYPSYPTLTIVGPSTNPVVTNTTTGAALHFLSGYSVASGHSVAVDTLNHLAILDSATNQTGSLDFVNSTWPTIVRGNNTFSLSGGGSVLLSWRDCWT